MTRPIHTAPTDGTEIIVGDTSPAWEHRVRWERNGFAIDRERFAENPTYWRPCDPPAPEPVPAFPEFEPIPAPAAQGEDGREFCTPEELERYVGNFERLAPQLRKDHAELIIKIQSAEIARLTRELEEARAAFLRDQAVEKLTDELALARAALREIVSKSHYPDEGIARRALASAEQKP